MAITVKETGNGSFKREEIPAGLQVARCYSIIHLGTLTWDLNGETKQSNKIQITWELPNEMRVFKEENGLQPMVVSEEYTLSLHEKSNLRPMLESWRGKSFSSEELRGFNITKLLGVTCMINITHNNSGYAKPKTINPLIKGMECPPQINESFEFNYDDKFDYAWVMAQPDFIKNKITSTPEFDHRTMSLVQEEKLKQQANDGFTAPPPGADGIPAEEEMMEEPPF